MLAGALGLGWFQTAACFPVSKQLISFFNTQLPQHQAQVKVTSLACWSASSIGIAINAVLLNKPNFDLCFRVWWHFTAVELKFLQQMYNSCCYVWTRQQQTVDLTLYTLRHPPLLSHSNHPSSHLIVSLSLLVPSITPFPPCYHPPTPNMGKIWKLWWQHRSWGRSYLSQTDQEVCDGGVDGCCRSVTLAGARQAGPHGSGTVGLQTDGTWWVTNN